jgi:hypothetical protein
MAGNAKVVGLSTRQRAVLERLVRTRTLAQHLAERCRIALGSADGETNLGQADALGVDRQLVRRWRGRFAAAHASLAAAEAEGASEAELEELIVDALSDEDRSGAPSKFTPEQVVAIVALACEPTKDSGLEISHWTPRELARVAISRGIVESISPRQVDRFLARRP